MHSCGTLPEAGRDQRNAGSNYERIFRSAIRAVDDIGYSVAESDVNRGMIVAEKVVVDSERGTVTHRLNISIESAPVGIKVEVMSDDAEGDNKPLKTYVEVLKKRAPADLNVVSRSRQFPSP